MKVYIRKLEAKVVEQAKLLGMLPKSGTQKLAGTAKVRLSSEGRALKKSNSQDGSKLAYQTLQNKQSKNLNMKSRILSSGHSRSGTISQGFEHGRPSTASTSAQTKLQKALDFEEIINS